MAVNPPTNVNINDGSSGNHYYVLVGTNPALKLVWSGASGSGITGYLVKQRHYDGSSWSDFEDYISRPTVTTTATSGNVGIKPPTTAGHQYQYVVYTMAGSTLSSASSADNARPKIVVYSAGKAPTSVSISATLTTTASASLTLSWSGAAGGIQNELNNYTVQQNNNGSGWVNVANTTATSVTVTGPVAGATNYWRVVANCDHASYTSGQVQCQHYTNGTASIGGSSATTTSGQSFTLTWTATAGTNNAISIQRIQRSTDNSTWTDAYTGLDATARSHTVSGPTTSSTIYYYRVVVSFARNIVTTGSMSRVYYTDGACTTPTISKTSTTTVNDSLTLSWGAVAGTNNAISGFDVYRGSTKLNSTRLAASTRSYAVTGPASGETYYWHVEAIFARNAVSTASVGCIHFTMGTCNNIAISKKSTTTVNDSLTLSWAASAGTNNAIIGFDVYRGSTKLNSSRLAATTRSYAVTGPGSGQTFSWTVHATFGRSGAVTDAVSCIHYTNGTCSISVSPSGWTTSTGNANITVTRASGTNNGPNDYTVQRSTDNNTWSNLATGQSGTSYAVAISDTYYYYRVVAPFLRNTVTTGSVSVGHYTNGTAPSTVTIGASKLTVGSTTTLTWSGAAAGTNNALSKYTVEYSDNSGAWTSYSTSATSTLSVAAPAAGVTRRYRVTAVYANNTVSSSVYGSVTGYAAPGAPTSVTVPTDCYGSTAYTVTWSGASGGIDHYESQYCRTNNGTWGSWSASTNRSGTSFSDTWASLTVGQKGKYRIRTINGAGTASAWKESNEITKRNTAPTTPGTPTVSPLLLENGSVSLSWTASTDVDASTGGGLSGYSIEFATRANDTASWGNWTVLTTVSTNAYTHAWAGTSLNQIKYRIRAYDSQNAYSGYSGESSVVTRAVTDPIVLPAIEGVCYDRRPYLQVLVYVLAATELQARTGNTGGSWGAWTTCTSLNAGTNRWMGRCPVDLATGTDAAIQLRIGSGNPIVTFALRYEAPAYAREITTGSVIANTQISHVAEMNQMLGYVNDMRRLYGLQVISFADSVGYFATWSKNICQLQNGINELYATIHGDAFTPRNYTTLVKWPTASEINFVRRRIAGDET